MEVIVAANTSSENKLKGGFVCVVKNAEEQKKTDGGR